MCHSQHTPHFGFCSETKPPKTKPPKTKAPSPTTASTTVKPVTKGGSLHNHTIARGNQFDASDDIDIDI